MTARQPAYGADSRWNSGAIIDYEDEGKLIVAADIVVLRPAVTGAEGAEALNATLDTSLDRFGFFEELHGRLDSARSKMKGIYLAGACQAPMDIQKSISQGMASAGYVLSGLADGRKLEIDPITARCWRIGARFAVPAGRCARI